MDDLEKMHALLLSYVGILAELHELGPDENLEYMLWDDLHRHPDQLELISKEQRNELIFLIIHTDSWVAYNFETGMFQIVEMDAWLSLLSKRGH